MNRILGVSFIFCSLSILGCAADGWYVEVTPYYGVSEFEEQPSRPNFSTAGGALTFGYRFGIRVFQAEVLAALKREEQRSEKRAEHEVTMEQYALTALAANPNVNKDTLGHNHPEVDLNSFKTPETLIEAYIWIIWVLGLCAMAFTFHKVGALKWVLNQIRPSKQTEKCDDDT